MILSGISLVLMQTPAKASYELVKIEGWTVHVDCGALNRQDAGKT